LQDQFEQKLNESGQGDNAVVGSSSSSSTNPSTPASTPTDGTTPTSLAPPAEAPPEGDVLGKVEIPKIGLSAYVVEGVGVDDLKNGPGHYPGTPLPGQQGNASIAGHRTTYGAPFANIDDLHVGDQITVTTLQGTFTYAVVNPPADAPGYSPDHPYQIVKPTQVDVLDNKNDNRLTLTACHPKYSASERIVVTAALQGTALPAPTPTTTPGATGQAATSIDANLSGKAAPKLPAILLGLLCAAIWVAAWFIGKRWRKWPAYLIGLPFFLVALFYFFENFSRLLPPNY